MASGCNLLTTYIPLFCGIGLHGQYQNSALRLLCARAHTHTHTHTHTQVNIIAGHYIVDFTATFTTACSTFMKLDGLQMIMLWESLSQDELP